MEEIWKPVVGFEGYYEVSSLGRVRSVDRIVKGGRWGTDKHLTGAIMSQCDGRRGYKRVIMSRDGKPRLIGVHRLVCEAFHGAPPTPDHVVAHFPDKDPSNNHADNLMWATHTENMAHRVIHGTDGRGERNPFYGRRHTAETRARISEAAKLRERRRSEARAAPSRRARSGLGDD